MFDWAEFRTAKGGIKLHTSFDIDMMLPDVVNITEAKVHDRYGFNQLIFQNTIIVEDRAYFDFELMRNRIAASNVFVTRIKPTPNIRPSESLTFQKIKMDISSRIKS